MNACTETAPDIRVAGPLRDFLVRAFAPFRVTGVTRRRNAGRTGAVRVDTVVLHARGEGTLCIGGTDRESGTSICTCCSSCSMQKHGPHLQNSRSIVRHFVTNLSSSKNKCFVVSYQKYIRQERTNRDIILLTHNPHYVQKNIRRIKS